MRLEELKAELRRIGFPKGSIIAKYVKCGKDGCRKYPHGPYYYLVYKEGGKTKWKYIGKIIDALEVEKRKKAKAIVQRLKQIQKEKKKLEHIL